MVDIDDFKRINDTYGHQVGDRVLLCLAQRLVEDAGDNQFVARVGGEEFAVLFRATTMESAVERMTSTLKRDRRPRLRVHDRRRRSSACASRAARA